MILLQILLVYLVMALYKQFVHDIFSNQLANFIDRIQTSEALISQTEKGYLDSRPRCGSCLLMFIEEHI